MVAGGSSVVLAQETSLDTDASADIVNPFNIAEDFPLNFGSIIAGGAGDTVTLDPATGDISVGTGNVVLDGGDQVGVFSVNGIGSDVTLTVDTEVSLEGPGDPMAATLVTDPADTNSLTFADADTAIIVSVGGTLTVNAEQAEGAYTGTYNLAFDFN